MDRLQVELTKVRRQLELAIDEACQTASEHEEAQEQAVAAGVSLTVDQSWINQSRRLEVLNLGRATALTWALSLIDDAIARAAQPVVPKGTDRLVFIGSKLPGMDDYPPQPEPKPAASPPPAPNPTMEMRRP